MRSVMSHYHGSNIFWITTKGSSDNKDGDSNKNGKKTHNFMLVKQQLLHADHTFLHIF